jgi:hypothetical protein
MTGEPTFTVEHDGGRVALVPDFWPSKLDADDRRKYDGLRSLHVLDDGALSVPAEYLPRASVEPGSRVSLDAVWTARTDRLGAHGVGPYAAGQLAGIDAERDRIARDLFAADDDGRRP